MIKPFWIVWMEVVGEEIAASPMHKYHSYEEARETAELLCSKDKRSRRYFVLKAEVAYEGTLEVTTRCTPVSGAKKGHPCVQCQGTGVAEDPMKYSCPNCDGTGAVA